MKFFHTNTYQHHCSSSFLLKKKFRDPHTNWNVEFLHFLFGLWSSISWYSLSPQLAFTHFPSWSLLRPYEQQRHPIQLGKWFSDRGLCWTIAGSGGSHVGEVSAIFGSLGTSTKPLHFRSLAISNPLLCSSSCSAVCNGKFKEAAISVPNAIARKYVADCVMSLVSLITYLPAMCQ